ncbi:MAG: glycosyltransferase family 4 protein [Betaproteobacteria bacterium]
MIWRGLRIAIVGPLPPPAGGMAGQTQQLADLLRGEGADVLLVQTNAAYRPKFVAGIRGLRALFRLCGYAARLWNAAGKVEILHVMANSGWSWHVFAVPAIWIGRLRGRRVVVNYRGGEARAFLEKSERWVRLSLSAASALAVPSGFLEKVFAEFGIGSHVVPNIVDLSRFRPPDAAGSDARSMDRSPLHPSIGLVKRTVLVARNLEPIYDIASALRAFALVQRAFPGARMVVAGSGPEEGALKSLAGTLGIAASVEFPGRLDRDQMAARYRETDVALNSSRVDNMPNSVLEAMASGVPIVSTNVGGVPYIVTHERTALLVPAGNAEEMGAAIIRLLQDREFAAKLAGAALVEVQRYTWPRVRDTLGRLYQAVLHLPSTTAHSA